MRHYNRAQFAKAIYFASYYNKRNKYFDEYVAKFFLRDGRRDIDKFASLWERTQREQGFDLDFWDRLQDLHYYKKTLKKGKLGSDDKVASILTHKQFFGVPWLVCYRELV